MRVLMRSQYSICRNGSIAERMNFASTIPTIGCSRTPSRS